MSSENESEAPEQRQWTLEEVEQQTALLEKARASVAGLEADVEELSGQIAEALADGDDVADLQAERAKARTLAEDLAAACGILEARVAERRELALRALAQDRLGEIKKQLGGNYGEHSRRIERLARALAAVAEEVAKVDGAFKLQERLQDEAAALADRFDLILEPMKALIPPARDGAIAGLLSPTVPIVRVTDRRPRSQKPSAPTGAGGEILRLVGPRPPTPEEAARKAREEAAAERRRREEAEVRKALATTPPAGISGGPLRG